MGEETFLKIELDHQYGQQHTIGRFKLQARTGSVPGAGIPKQIREILTVAPKDRTKEQTETLLSFYASQDEEAQKLKLQLTELEKRARKVRTWPCGC